jgi:hypothetical protein
VSLILRKRSMVPYFKQGMVIFWLLVRLLLDAGVFIQLVHDGEFYIREMYTMA